MEYPNFKVCVRCFTFNHSKYITDAMNGFVMQQTDFPYVCCIVDDASKDGEQEVIRKYVSDNFDLSEGSCHFERETDYAFITYAQHKTNKNCYFAVLYLKENHYSIKKPKMPYLAEWRDGCEYEALCEGDDSWIVPNKLQKQVYILDNDDSVGLCYSNAEINYQNSGKVKIAKTKPYNGFDDLIIQNRIGTLTTMYRIELFEKYYKEVNPYQKKWVMGDWPLWLWLELNSKVVYLNLVTSRYRLLEESACHSQNIDKQLNFLRSHLEIAEFYMEKYPVSDVTRNRVYDYYYRHSAEIYKGDSDVKNYLQYLTKINYKTKKEVLKLWLLKYNFVQKILGI